MVRRSTRSCRAANCPAAEHVNGVVSHGFDRRPDPLWMEHRGRSRRRTLVILLVVLLATYVAAVVIRPPVGCNLPGAGCGDSTAITATVKPIPPLSMSDCVAEMRRWGRGGSTATSACREGRGRAWFRAVVANTTGDRTAVLCDVYAFRASGKQIGAKIPVPVYIVQEPGVMVLNAHQTRTVEWFFDPHDAPKNIGAAARFITRCRRNPSPPF
jgi:hypothetical protein